MWSYSHVMAVALLEFGGAHSRKSVTSDPLAEEAWGLWRSIHSRKRPSTLEAMLSCDSVRPGPERARTSLSAFCSAERPATTVSGSRSTKAAAPYGSRATRARAARSTFTAAMAGASMGSSARPRAARRGPETTGGFGMRCIAHAKGPPTPRLRYLDPFPLKRREGSAGSTTGTRGPSGRPGARRRSDRADGSLEERTAGGACPW